MQALFLPVLHSFENNNIFTGSFGALRFRVVPAITMKTPKEVDFDASSMTAEVWHGAFCYKKSSSRVMLSPVCRASARSLRSSSTVSYRPSVIAPSSSPASFPICGEKRV